MKHAKTHIAQSLVLAICSMPVVSILAQSVDTSAVLEEIEVIGVPTVPSPGAVQIVFDDSITEAFAGRHVGDLLNREAGIFIKSYGPGGIATISMRGASSGQTAVHWNGLSVANQMLGVADFSLMPTGMFDEISLQLGGNSSLVGSGAVSGSIQLKIRDAYQSGLRVGLHTQLGSFGLWEQLVRVGYGSSRFSTQTTILYKESVNDLRYELAGNERHQTHADFEQKGVLQSLRWKTGRCHELKADIWWQTTFREIPPTTVQNISEATQTDDNFRLSLRWNYRLASWSHNITGGYTSDIIDYADPQIKLTSLTRANNYTLSYRAARTIASNGMLQLGVEHQQSDAAARSYKARADRAVTGISGNFAQEQGLWSYQIGLRQELIDGQLAPISGSLGARVDAWSWLSLNLKLSRDFRMPGLNALHWRPGGNPELQPEYGWSQEFGLDFQDTRRNFSIQARATAFNRNIQDWILWSIRAGESFWSANNVTEVHSRGLENRIAVTLKRQEWQWEANAGYDFITSTNEVNLQSPQIAAGEQLPYTPRHQGQLAFDTKYQGLSVTYSHHFTGRTHSVSGDILNSYQIGSVRVQYNTRFKAFNLRLYGEIDNIFNSQYRIIEFRPMPGRNYRAGLAVIFTKKYHD